MREIKLIAETEDTVTIARADWDRLMQEVEDSRGSEKANARSLTLEETKRILDGENVLRVWREKRGFQQVELANVAEITPRYLSDIEKGRKIPSIGVYARLARGLRVSIDDLVV